LLGGQLYIALCQVCLCVPKVYTTTLIKIQQAIKMLEKTEGQIKNGQSRDTGDIGYTRRRQTKTKSTTQKTKRIGNTDSTKNRRWTQMFAKD